MNGDTYLAVLEDKLMLQLESLGKGLSEWFQQDGATAYFAYESLIPSPNH